MIAYLIQGPPSTGKTTYGRKMADLGGVCISFDDYFYTVANPTEPEVYNFDAKKKRSSSRWFWLKLKEAADAGTTPIYVDQNNAFQAHTWRTAAFLMERYGYDIELAHPVSPQWSIIRLLLENKEENAQKLAEWSYKLSKDTDKQITPEKMLDRFLNWEDYTVDDLIDQF